MTEVHESEVKASDLASIAWNCPHVTVVSIKRWLSNTPMGDLMGKFCSQSRLRLHLGYCIKILWFRFRNLTIEPTNQLKYRRELRDKTIFTPWRALSHHCVPYIRFGYN
ncbi:hypothetical protein NPIL_460401 [Nephila pilipes]|uniref:Uncharacterized protein n=1 Tax=Nephila pilipes TaxID=299642 RepID=A0A8X6PEQ1_NEPPI|nr:hypothetical protein NPIL_460401 [Nephila pilipes]